MRYLLLLMAVFALNTNADTLEEVTKSAKKMIADKAVTEAYFKGYENGINLFTGCMNKDSVVSKAEIMDCVKTRINDHSKKS